MIKELLLDFQYYLNRLSKFMQESYGINEQVRTFHSLLKQVDNYYNQFLNQLDIMNTIPEGEMLDKIGAIFGCYRNFTIPIYDPVNIYEIVDYGKINLNNKDFLTYIKTQIIKQNFDGTREELQKLYSTWKSNYIQKGIVDLVFLYTTEVSQNGAICTIRWDTQNPSVNMRLLFENGYLTIESVGVLYKRQITNFNNLAYYYLDNETPTPQNYYTQTTYNILTSEPSDWTSGGYYKLSSSTPTSSWDNRKVYVKVINGDYVLIPHKPTNWDSIYSSCYILDETVGTETFAQNTYYEADILGGLYS